MPEHIPLNPSGAGLKVAVLVSRWYAEVTDRLRDAALETLAKAGVADEDVFVLEVPGAYELPQAATWVARGGDADVIVALGCIVRGETPHFDHVARECSQGLSRVAAETGLPVSLGVITADTHEQAIARSGPSTGKGGNKGIEAAEAAIAMGAAFKALEARRRKS